MAGYSQIKTKVEAAFAAIIGDVSGLSSITVYRRYSGLDVKGRRIEVICENATPEVEGDLVTGNWNCSVTIALYDHVTVDYDTRTGFENLLFDLLMRDDVVAQLNAAGVADFTVFGGASGAGAGAGWIPGPVRSEIGDGGMLREIMTGDLYCCPSGGDEDE